ncbi:MAG TPA: hypothetical protein VMW28_04260 [Pelolinea sp.]|nr:hypothetical protein [Pelolinea sp.]
MPTKTKLIERLAELELALEDVGWTRLWSDESEMEFSREGLGKIARLSRLMYLKNPLVNRGVNVKRNYVWGQGISIKAPDPDVDAVIQQFMNDRKNLVELTGHSAQTLKETDLECDGNVFLVLFTDKSKVKLRSIPFVQVMRVITNPEDAKDPWYYQREWQANGRGKKALYPAWTYNPKNKPATIDSVKVMWDSPVMHVKVGGFSDWKFGVSEVYASIDWARAYKEFLEDWATITRAYARFAWDVTVKGGTAAVAAVKSKFDAGDPSTTTKPSPAVASMAIMGEGNTLTPIRTAGATTTPEDGRRIMLMVSAALGLPETFFGDVSVGTLATATSLDRPTELNMIDRQMLWTSVFTDILNYVLLQAIKGNVLKGKADLEAEPDTLEQIKWKGSKFDDQVQIRFPEIIEGVKADNVKSIVEAAMTGLLDTETLARLLLTALGEQDVEQTLEDMRDEENPDAVEAWKKISSFMEKYYKVKI